jgi:hypothetical protein
MSLQRRSKQPVIIVGLVFVVLLLVWLSAHWHAVSTTEQEQEESGGVPARVSVQNRQRVIILDKEARVASGIVVAPPEPISRREELQAYGTVMELQGLIDLRTTLIDKRKTLIDLRRNSAAAEAQVEKTRASLDASSKQYDRLKLLYDDNQNISAKALQAAEVSWRSDHAAARAALESLDASRKLIGAAEETLHNLELSVLQQWGGVLKTWLFDNTPAFERLARQQDLLIQVTLPSGVQISSATRSIRVKTASGSALAATLVSPSPRTDPRIQGLSYFYTARAQTGILPGMNVQSHLSYGSPLKGVLVPASAIVWWRGKAWIYVQKDSNQFIRREISTETPMEDGVFVREGLSREDLIAVKGVQILLSIETDRGQEG